MAAGIKMLTVDTVGLWLLLELTSHYHLWALIHVALWCNLLILCLSHTVIISAYSDYLCVYQSPPDRSCPRVRHPLLTLEFLISHILKGSRNYLWSERIPKCIITNID